MTKKKIGKKKVDEIISDRWIFEVRMVVAPLRMRIDETAEEGKHDMWEMIYSALESECVSVLNLDLNQLQITRREEK